MLSSVYYVNLNDWACKQQKYILLHISIQKNFFVIHIIFWFQSRFRQSLLHRLSVKVKRDLTITATYVQFLCNICSTQWVFQISIILSILFEYWRQRWGKREGVFFHLGEVIITTKIVVLGLRCQYSIN